ncbi:6-phosphogluconate dehydrogenase [Altererythrobacter sp. B11]|uniref:NAD(P)-dependent oxidoreductase n=1 Tax=Altererythrobacter sp. B11 TaxID=2060312 RepID=UPI000DC7384B|nr:NAD(P)-dependent oxidoreductase [Altererythrobacter sp. B11]BBC71114.1 6-phosphogluconate dehydrogenase [Altererythrobacter sp. B11]
MPDSKHLSATPRVALIGFGEAGMTFARAGGWTGRASGWDIAPERRALMGGCGVEAGDDAAAALADADIVLCLVTADSALPAAQDYAALLPPGALWCDMNSVAPGTKREAAAAIEAAGGRYVDVAVMAPVDPVALGVPLLIAGPHARDAQQALAALGFAKSRVVGDEVGRASAIKMIRSVMVKGLEALSSECAAAADAAGVFDEVMASLDASEKTIPWAERIAYNRERMATHGLRRAAEMEESAKTLLGLGVEPVMTRGTVLLQRQAAGGNRERN